MDNLEIITTSDGSHSLLNKELNETYHSHHGAIQESLHVFIKNGLDFWLNQFPASNVNIFEVGFGTGLNALLTIQESVKYRAIFSYTSIEAFPLEKNVWSELNYASTPDEKIKFNLLHDSDWNKPANILSNFSLLKLKSSLQDVVLRPSSHDVVYYDAFAPNKQPDMWTVPMLEKVVESMRTAGVFVTYCAKGQLKRDLKMLGLQVDTLGGPPGKKEMVRALKK
jgi:tRNA U34 5-methylaminomethyl-2-thiouridine-forming methyltransferase MnmC